MAFFLTKVWGWGIPVGPLQFSSKGWRDNALSQLEPSDRVVLVGTMGDQTPEDMKGRVLGVMEPTREPVMSLDFAVRQKSGDFVEGEYKWPYGLMNLRAWSIPARPRLAELTNRRFSMDSAQGIVPLSDEERSQLQEFEWREEALLQPSAQAQARMNRKYAAPKRTAPPPTTTRRGAMHMRRAPAYTYAMRIVGAQHSAFKIGWAFDFKKRARQFNHAAMPSLGGLEYKPFLFQLWDTARIAYVMEQKLLETLSDKRHPANNEIVLGVKDGELEAIWTAGVDGRLLCDQPDGE